MAKRGQGTIQIKLDTDSSGFKKGMSDAYKHLKTEINNISKTIKDVSYKNSTLFRSVADKNIKASQEMSKSLGSVITNETLTNTKRLATVYTESNTVINDTSSAVKDLTKSYRESTSEALKGSESAIQQEKINREKISSFIASEKLHREQLQSKILEMRSAEQKLNSLEKEEVRAYNRTKRAQKQQDYAERREARQKVSQATSRSKFKSNPLASLGAVAAASLSVRSIIGSVDEFTEISNRLKLVTKDVKELGKVRNELFKISTTTGQSINSVAQAYQRLAENGQKLGMSQNKVLKVTDTLTKAVALSGASSASAEAAIIQLGQGLAAGVLRGAELNSVMQQTPALAQAIASGLGVSIGELKKLGEQGKLTAEVVINALEQSADSVDRKITSLDMTFSQRMQNIKTNFIKVMGDLNKSTGTMNLIGKVMEKVSENLDLIIKSLGSIALYLAVGKMAKLGSAMFKAGNAFIGAAKGVGIFSAAMKALKLNPIYLAITAVTTALGFAYNAYKKWQTRNNEDTQINQLFTKSSEDFAKEIKDKGQMYLDLSKRHLDEYQEKIDKLNEGIDKNRKSQQGLKYNAFASTFSAQHNIAIQSKNELISKQTDLLIKKKKIEDEMAKHVNSDPSQNITKQVEMQTVVNQKQNDYLDIIREIEATEKTINEQRKNIEYIGKTQAEIKLLEQANEIEQINQNIKSARNEEEINHWIRLKEVKELSYKEDERYHKKSMEYSNSLITLQGELLNSIKGNAYTMQQLGRDMGNMINSTTQKWLDMVVTGKQSFKNFAKSVIDDLLKMIKQQLIFNAASQISQVIGNKISSLIPATANFIGSIVPATANFINRFFSSGGYTGDGGKYQPAGIVHRGEFVFSKEAVSRIGLGNLDKLHRGFANGGAVGMSIPRSKAATVNITINNNMAGVADVYQDVNDKGEITIDIVQKVAKTEAFKAVEQYELNRVRGSY